MVLTTLIVTFVLVVGLAAAVLLVVAAPPLRASGNRWIARYDAWWERVSPRVHATRARVQHRAVTIARPVVEDAAARLQAQRARRADERETAHQH
ncbi:hypothetical protein [Kineococcus sp. SYSU DK004]|uniref:hypothetical protein n=1 Tax=Kineococcus sp. SYSU DK004 TaxID=3383125 RepID=UPI003D7DCEB4